MLPNRVLGAHSMMRCPLCRENVDRVDLQQMGYDVSPKRMTQAAGRCNALRSLMHGVSHANNTGFTTPEERVTRLIQMCAQTTGSDGLVYNTCVLHVERALAHRKHFIADLEAELSSRQVRTEGLNGEMDMEFNQGDFITSRLLGHIETLTGNCTRTQFPTLMQTRNIML